MEETPMPDFKQKETNVVKIIKDLMRAGESEDSIIRTLVQTGITENQARRLLSVSQADTFALLEAEIGKIAREQINNELPRIQTYLDRALIQLRSDLESKMKSELRGGLAEIREDIKRDINLLHDLNNTSIEKTRSIEEKVAALRQEVKDMKMRRLGTKNEWVALLLVLGGIAFFVTALYLLITQFQYLTMDLLILIITISITGTVMFFSASVV
ncbi:MAG: hypothetical protein N3F05_00520 [Candidatus Diapherotrites archaeon]|nr:hypothetical protein [Candidatus Diapherotrites archaeon]